MIFNIDGTIHNVLPGVFLMISVSVAAIGECKVHFPQTLLNNNKRNNNNNPFYKTIELLRALSLVDRCI